MTERGGNMSTTALPGCRACGGVLKLPETEVCLDCGAEENVSERTEIIMLACVVVLVMLLSAGAIWTLS